MKFRIKYADQVVGLFVLLSMLALAAALVFIGINQRWFAKNYYFKSEFESGSGINAGKEILLKGFIIGKIDSIKLNDRNTVDMKFHIFDTYIEKVRENSVLELATSPIPGFASPLLLHPGKSDLLATEGTLIPNMTSDAGIALIDAELVEVPVKDDTISRLLANINPLLENTNRLIINLNKTTTDINKSLQGQGTGPLGKILVNTDKSMESLAGIMATTKAEIPGMFGDVSELLVSVKLITKNLEGMSEAFKDPTGLIPKLIDPKGSLKTFLDDNNVLFDKVEKMFTDVELTLRNFQRMSESLKAEIPKISSILDEGKTTLQKAQDVMEGLKNNPLLKGGVPERKEQEASLQSIRDEGF